MRKAIGIALFIASLFCITGAIPNILSEVVTRPRPEFVVGYVIGLGLLFASSRMFEKRYTTLVFGIAALIAGLHVFFFLYVVGQKGGFGIFLGCIYIMIAIAMTGVFIHNRRKDKLPG
jgi:FtsH-binding integral membrane protein